MDYHSFMSDYDLDQEYIIGLKNRKLEQKFNYLGIGAKRYYDAIMDVDNRKESDNTNIHYEYVKRNIDKDSKTAIISLGCGSAYDELGMLEKMSEEGYNIVYFGVDSSKEMLGLASKELEKTRIKAKLICADFTSGDFKAKLDALTSDYDSRVFFFLGYTFGNPSQTLITDSLYNIMNRNDYLWIDVLTRNNDNHSTVMKIFKRYEGFISGETKKKFRFSGLERVGLSLESGRFVLDMRNERSIGAKVFAFSFLFEKKSVIRFRNNTIHILPDERIELTHIRNYNLDALLHFMKEHEFVVKDELTIAIDKAVNKTYLMFSV